MLVEWSKIIPMKIVDRKNAAREIIDTIMSKARYQKVVFCLDKNSDMKLVENVCESVGRNAVVIRYYYNKKNIAEFFNMINNGVRVVVYDVSVKHFYKLQNNNSFLLNIFIPQENFVLPYMNNVDSMYGDNVLICDPQNRDYYTTMVMYELALDNLWSKLLQGVQVDTEIFKRIDNLVKCDNFYNELLSVFVSVKNNLTDEYRKITDNDCGYILMRICCIMQMLKNVDNGEIDYIDFYKEMQSSEDVAKAYQLLIKYDVIDTLKLYSKKLIKITSVIVNRIKIIIIKYLYKQINFKKHNKIIKNATISLNIDNLLYISYILNCV